MDWRIISVAQIVFLSGQLYVATLARGGRGTRVLCNALEENP